MSSTKTIPLDDTAVYDIGGKVYTLKELQQHAIDAYLLKELKESIKD